MLSFDLSWKCYDYLAILKVRFLFTSFAAKVKHSQLLPLVLQSVTIFASEVDFLLECDNMIIMYGILLQVTIILEYGVLGRN